MSVSPASPEDGSQHRAVFLSYAREDSAAAQRIAEALRSRGVEVWLDQDELRGGDSWDQKIRRQVRDCALFIPIISEHTQSRPEGYFRLEWKLADDRTHLMAKGTAFLLPVCVDGTKDWDAIVPDSFTAVQWTRLPGGDTPSAFCDRVKTLLMVGPKPEARPQRPASGSAGGNSAPPRLWIAPVLVGLAVIVALGFWQPWRRGATTPLPTPVSVVSEADQLIARAQAQIGKTDSTVDDAAVAEDLCRHAVELAPDSPRAWAERAYVQSYYIQRTWDSSEKRLQDTQTFANRALALDPNESEAMLALSTVLLRQGSFPQAETMLRQALALQPGDARIWRRITIVRCCSLNIMPVPATPRTQWSISENASTSARITPIGPWRTTPGGISCADSPSLTPC